MTSSFEYFENLKEPARSVVLVLKDIILEYDEKIESAMSYGMPFFFYKGKRFAYLWMDKKTGDPYIGFTDGLLLKHPKLESNGRKKMKSLSISVDQDIDLDLVQQILGEALAIKGNS